MKQINILDLHRTINEKKMRTSECYDKILDICHKKIQTGADNQRMNCFIEVPSYVFGYPIFNFNNCIEYVYNSLRKNGFLVKYYFPKYLYVSWDFDEINANKNISHTSSPPKVLDGPRQKPMKGALSYKPSGKLTLDLS